MNESASISRRRFMELGAAVAVLPMLASCTAATTEPGPNPRFTARPGTPTIAPTLGLSVLGLGGTRDGVLYVPTTYKPTRAAPLMVALHGAGGTGPGSWTDFYALAEARGMVFLAPSSRDGTWDLIASQVGPDVAFIDKALAHTFARCNIDASHICLGGFSDGATYALAISLSNGDLVTHTIAYSPGFLAVSDILIRRPRMFISHGTVDAVVNYAGTANTIVPTLRGNGYDVTFVPYDGGHTIPSSIANASLDWFLGAAPTVVANLTSTAELEA